MSKEALDFDVMTELEQVTVAGRVDPQQEDSYWEHSFSREGYYSAGLAYEAYAPAYCVGYIGYAQYGGSFDDAEKSLCANWLRIKGDSPLSIEQALPAMRAAWDRMARPRIDPSAQAAASPLSAAASLGRNADCAAFNLPLASSRVNQPARSISA